MKLKLLLAAVAISLVSANPVRAQLMFELTPSQHSTSPNATVTFSGTLTNSGSEEMFLNSTGVSLNALGLTADETKFLNSAPASLLPGGKWSGEVLDVMVSPEALSGSYTGFFSILGGRDSDARDLLAQQTFTVNVVENTVPEPGQLTLLGTSVFMVITGSILLFLRRRCSKSAESQ